MNYILAVLISVIGLSNTFSHNYDIGVIQTMIGVMLINLQELKENKK